MVCFAVIVVNAQDQCEAEQFHYCQTLLAEGIGLTTTTAPLMFKDYTVLYNWFLQKWSLTPGNTTDILNVCNQLEFFNKCMHNNSGCFQIQNLLQETDLNNAFFINGTLAMYQFNCGPGISTLFHEDIFCTQLIIDNYRNYLQECVSTYLSSIIHDYKYGCRYVKDLMNCWSAPFGGSGELPLARCRTANTAALWWACEANRVFTLNQFPNCVSSCDVQGQSLILKSHLETHYKVENGVHFYKIPNYMSIIGGKVQPVEGPWMKD